MKRRAPSLIVILLLVVGSASNGLSQPENSRQIGVLLPLSGDYAHIGEQLLESIELALEDSPGLAWTVLDTRGDPDVARRRAEELAANPGVLAIVGPVGASACEAASAVAESHGIPLLTLTSRHGIETSSSFVFRMRVSPVEQSRYMAEIAVGELGLRRFAVVYPDDDFGRSTMRAFVDGVVGSGVGRVTAIESYEVDTTEFNDALELVVNRNYRELRTGRRGRPSTRSRLLSSRYEIDFDAVFLPDYAEQVGLMAPFLDFWEVPLGGRMQLLGLSSWAGRLSKAGSLLRGAIFTQVFDGAMYDDDVRDFIARFRESYEREPSEAEAQAYDAIRTLDEAIDRVRGVGDGRAQVADYLRSMPERDGLGGSLSIGPDGAVVRGLSLFSVDDRGFFSPYFVIR